METIESICNSILLKIELIKSIKHCSKINSGLEQYKSIIEQIKLIRENNSDKYTKIKELLNIKTIHFHDYEHDNLLILINIKRQFDSLYEYIQLFNSINKSYDEEYKKVWLEGHKDQYNTFCIDFDKPLPCMELYINTIESELIKIKKEPVKPVNTNSIYSIKINKNDFKSDGGYSLLVIPELKDFEIASLTHNCFKRALCGIHTDCNKETQVDIDTFIKERYNEYNYKEFLKYINFNEYPVEKIINILHEGEIYLNASDFDGMTDSICCIKSHIKRVTSEGGKRRRKTYKKKKTRKVNRK